MRRNDVASTSCAHKDFNKSVPNNYISHLKIWYYRQFKDRIERNRFASTFKSITVGQGPTALAVGADGGCLDIFTLIYPFSLFSPSLWETARYRLKYCLKGPLNPQQPTNQPTNLQINLKLHLLLFYPSTWYNCDFFLFHIEIEGKCG